MDAATTQTDAIGDSSQLWLHAHLAAAERPYLLWRENQACVRTAQRQAREMPARHGEMLVRANVEARRMSALLYLAQLGAAVDHAKLAMEAHDVSDAALERLHGRVQMLEALAGEPMAEVA